MGDFHKDIMALNDPALFETGCANRVEQVCLRQTAGDSAGPERNIVQSLPGHWFGNHNVADE